MFSGTSLSAMLAAVMGSALSQEIGRPASADAPIRRRSSRKNGVNDNTRFDRKTKQHGGAYAPGKLFKGHRI